MNTYDVLVTETITYRYSGIVEQSPEEAELTVEQMHLDDTNRDRCAETVLERSVIALRRAPAP